jgi:hypothetical protein
MSVFLYNKIIYLNYFLLLDLLEVDFLLAVFVEQDLEVVDFLQEQLELLLEPYNWLIAIVQKYSSCPAGQPAFCQL